MQLALGPNTLGMNGGAAIGSSYYTTAPPSNGLIVQGNIGIGTTAPGTTFVIAADSDVYTSPTDAQLLIQGSTNTNQYLAIGYDTALDRGIIQPKKSGTAYEPLLLNPLGANVGIAVAGTPTSTLSVGGGVAIGANYTTGTPAPLNGAIVQGNVGIGSTSPISSLDISQKTDALALPSGTTGQRPTGTNGMIRYNSTVPQVEAYYSGGWNVLGGGGATTTTLGTSASATNPQRSGQVTTGFYSAATNTVAVASGGIEAQQWNRLASGVDYLSVTPGKSGTAVTIAVAGSTSPQSLNFAPNGALGVLQFNANTMFWQDMTNYNVVIGATAFPSVVSQAGGGGNGQGNVAVGYQVLNANTTGSSNTGLGMQALNANTTGDSNTALGAYALRVNTIGRNNTSVGAASLFNNTAGTGNIAIGAGALYANTTGGGNTAIGNSAMTNNTTGINNTVIGYYVGGTLNGGIGNILIGALSTVDTKTAATNYSLNIGNLLQGDMTNSTALGTEALYLQSTASSVDYLQIAGATAATATIPVSAQGTDTNVSIALMPKGSGSVGIGTPWPASGLDVAIGEIYMSHVGSGNGFKLGSSSASPGIGSGNGWMGINPDSNGLYIGSAYNVAPTNSLGVYAVEFIGTGTSTLMGVGLDGSNNATVSASTALHFQTAGTETMTIGATGKVGIGTSAPTNFLHIVGPSDAHLEFETSSGSSGPQIRLKQNAANGGHEWDFISAGTNNGSQSAGDFGIRDETAGAYRMAITAGGNVGIGTTSPGSALDIKQNNTADSFAGLVKFGNGSNSYDPTLEFYKWSGVASNYLGFRIEGDTNGLIFFSAASAALGSQSFSETMRVSAAGHLEFKGASPTINACGTSPSVVGNDNSFIITTGTAGPTACTATFSAAWSNTPSCNVTPNYSVTAYVSAASTTAITITLSAAATSRALYVNCFGHN